MRTRFPISVAIALAVIAVALLALNRYSMSQETKGLVVGPSPRDAADRPLPPHTLPAPGYVTPARRATLEAEGRRKGLGPLLWVEDGKPVYSRPHHAKHRAVAMRGTLRPTR
jgi:hypothetical protein